MLYYNMKEKTIATKKIFSGRLLGLKVLKVKLPDGRTTWREIVYHPGAVAIVPILQGNKIILVQQYRKAVGENLLEIPAGTLHPKEKPLKCAQRELIEETGYKANNMEKILDFYSTPGYTTEKIYLFKATGLVKTKSRQEKDEFIKIVIITIDRLKKMFKEGHIKDAKTIVALSCLKLI